MNHRGRLRSAEGRLGDPSRLSLREQCTNDLYSFPGTQSDPPVCLVASATRRIGYDRGVTPHR